MGLGQSVVTPFASGIIAAYFTVKTRGIAFSIFNFGTYASFSLSLSLGTFMYDEYGWKAGYLLFGVLGMAIGLVTPVVMSDGPSQQEEEESILMQVGEKTDKSVDEQSSEPLLFSGGTIFSYPRTVSEGSYYEIEDDDDDEVMVFAFFLVELNIIQFRVLSLHYCLYGDL